MRRILSLLCAFNKCEFCLLSFPPWLCLEWLLIVIHVNHLINDAFPDARMRVAHQLPQKSLDSLVQSSPSLWTPPHPLLNALRVNVNVNDFIPACRISGFKRVCWLQSRFDSVESTVFLSVPCRGQTDGSYLDTDTPQCSSTVEVTF